MGTPTIRVRPVRDEDIEFLCRFLHEYMDPSVSAKRFHRLFTYSWMAEKPDRGLVLTDGDRIVGFLGTVYADREVQGRRVRFCNLSSWYVLPEYRNHSLRLLTAAHSQQNVTFTNLTSRPAVEKVSLALRYEIVSVYKLFTVPFAQAWGLLTEPRPKILLDRSQIAKKLTGPLLKIFEDHAPTHCGHLIVESAGASCYVIWNRRVKHSVPFSEILYVSDPGVLRCHFEWVKLPILWQDRTLLLAVDQSLLGERSRLMYPYRRVTLFRSSEIGQEAIDSLYSELVLL
jgi:hypothetical protein